MGSNSIYEYYKQVSDRYFIAQIFNDSGKVKIEYRWDPIARKVKIAGFEDFDLFVYKNVEFKRNKLCYYLCEGLTGSVILKQCDLPFRVMRRATLKLFCEYISMELTKLGGKAQLNRLISNWLFDHDQEYSPRYMYLKTDI